MSATDRPPVVDLYLLRTADLDERALAADVLDPAERRRAAAFVPAGVRIQYIAAHVALRRLLGDRLGRPPQEVEFRRERCPCCGGPHGRPAVRGTPASLHFSLSHGGEFVLVGLAGTRLGVDVEPPPRPGTAEDLLPRLHPAERAELAAVAPEGRERAFVRLWTRKEAYLKGLGSGLGRPLDADYLGTADPGLLPEGWTVTDVPVGLGHAGAVAVHGAAHRVRISHLPPGYVHDPDRLPV